MSQKIVVVGAGLAGLTAAYELSKSKKYDITVLEAESVVGGCVQTATVDSVNYDLGGFMVFPWYKHFKKLLGEIGLGNELASLRSTVQFIQNDSSIKGDYSTYRRTPIRKLLPPRLVLGFITPLLKGKVKYYDPDLDYFGNETLEQFIDHKLGPNSEAKFILHTLTSLYGFSTSEGQPLSLTAGMAKYFALSRGFDKLKYLRNGTGTITDQLAEEITKNGGKIKTGVKVTNIKDKNAYFDDSSESADIFIFANGLYDGIVQASLGLEPDSLVYKSTDHYSCIVSTQYSPAINGITSWMAAYNNRTDAYEPKISSIFNISESMNVSSKNMLNVYLPINPKNTKQYSQSDITKIIFEELQKMLPDTGQVDVQTVKHWRDSTPNVSPKTVKVLRQAQGQNGYYFAGDYLGIPSMETAVFSGERVADMILSNY